MIAYIRRWKLLGKELRSQKNTSTQLASSFKSDNLLTYGYTEKWETRKDLNQSTLSRNDPCEKKRDHVYNKQSINNKSVLQLQH